MWKTLALNNVCIILVDQYQSIDKDHKRTSPPLLGFCDDCHNHCMTELTPLLFQENNT